MVEISKLLPLARTIVFGAVSVMALVVFALSAHIISLTSRAYGAYYYFTALGLATSILTLLTLPAMWFLSQNRRGAFTSYIVVEIVWCWFLWVMWLATGGSVAGLWGINSCRGGACSEAQVIEAFGFLSWLMLMAYVITLLVHSAMSHSRGHTNVWKSEVSQFDFTAPAIAKPVQGGVVGVVGVVYQEKPGAPQLTGGSLPPQMQMQVQYPPQGVPSPQPQPQPVPNTYVGAPAGGMPYAPQV